MADTNTSVVREFLEACNFTVMTNRKFHLQKADPPGRYSIDIIAKNLAYTEPESPLPTKLQANHMQFIPNAILDVKGWHTQRFSPSLIGTKPDLFHFVSPEPLEFAKNVFGGAPFKSIMVISEVVTTEQAWPKMEEMFRENGVDHVLEFPAILRFLLSHVEITANYVESDILQLLRLLKRYGLVKDVQLDLPFKRKPSNPEHGE